METKVITRFFYRLLKEQADFSETMAIYANVIINFILLLIVGYLIFKILRGFSEKIVHGLASKSKTQFDDFLVKNNTFLHLANLVTLYIISAFIPDILIDFPHLEKYTEMLVEVLVVVMSIWLIRSILSTFKDFLKTINAFKDKPIESYIQVFMIITWLFGFIIIFSIITGKPFLHFLTALGALSAVLLLIFKDTILGFVASIQVSVNDTVRIGDWITMEKYGADGDVFEINLSTVKVRNFDNTITTIPTYYLISDSFKNWRGMSVSGGRRIKRAVIIKTTSIKYLTNEEIADFKKIQLVADYIDHRQADIDKYNEQNNIDKSVLINGRNMTNFGLFRKYVDAYLHQHPAINKEMTIMTRQLEPTPTGVPLEVYAFSKDKVWANYEHIMADIFDHILAAAPYFQLEVFEYPTGKDFIGMMEEKK